MRFLIVSIVLICASASGAQPPVPIAVSKPSGLEGLVWHKWETDHFAVLSLDRSEGQRLKASLEDVRRDALARWGIRGSDKFFCKLVCVPDAEMLTRLFGLKEPRCEVRKSSDGKVDLVAIWIDEARISSLGSLVVESELSFGSFPAFMVRGVPLLERSPSAVRQLISRAPDTAFASIADEKKSAELVKSDAAGFDSSCALLCLMLRREYGPSGFALAASGSASSLPARLGFPSEADMDKTFARYRSNLLKDIRDSKTPDEYLSLGR